MKKFLSVILALTVILLTLSISVIAANPVKLTLTEESVYAGEEFNIQLLISDNSQMSGAVIDVNFDSRVLEFISAEQGAILDPNANISIKKIDEDSSKIRFTYLAPNSSVTSEGIVMNLTFKAMPSAVGETDLTITIPSAGDFVTADLEKISYEIVNSKIKITNTTLESTDENESESESETLSDSTTNETEAVETTTEPVKVNDNKVNNGLLPMFILLAVGICVIVIGVVLLISSKKKD